MKLCNKTTSQNCNIANMCKTFFIASISLLVVGIILFFTVGFQLGFDFTGGTEISVSLKSSSGNYTSEQINTSKQTISDVLNDLNVKNYNLLELDLEENKAILIRYQEQKHFSSEQNEAIGAEIISDLLVNFEYTGEDVSLISEPTEVGAFVGSELLVSTLAVILFAWTIVLIYLIIRFGTSYGLTTIFASLHSTLLILILALIFRVEISSNFFAILGLVNALSIASSVLLLSRVKENTNKESLETTSAVIEDAVKHNTKRIGITLVVGSLLSMVFLSGAFATFAFPLVLALIAEAYTSLYVTTPFWKLIQNNK